MMNTPSQPAVVADRFPRLLAACIKSGASDLHLCPGRKPMMRVHGVLDAMADETPVAAAEMEQVAADLGAIIPDGNRRGSVDGAWLSADGIRFRYNLYRRQGQLAVALRRLEDTFQSLSALGLPPALEKLCDLRDGLVIISGPTGSGKSTTLATLIDRINRTRSAHVVTIEDPIEYIHQPNKSLINQRQVGMDSPTFNDALVASLRQDPDVILVGEVREVETIRTAITAAETGHLVFTTLHAGDSIGAIERFVSVFPADEQESIRRQLSLVLKAVVAQHLVPREQTDLGGKDQPRRVPACEVLYVNNAIANLIALGKSGLIYSAMESGMQHGMQTLEHDLARLYVIGRISEVSAQAHAKNLAVLRDRIAILQKWARDKLMCNICGYDLRATPGRCPECGTIPKAW